MINKEACTKAARGALVLLNDATLLLLLAHSINEVAVLLKL